MITLIPNMTNNEDDNIKITCSSFYTSVSGAKYDSFLAFDDDINSGWNFEKSSQPGDWIKVEFKKIKPIVSKLILANGINNSVSVKDFVFQGSNDDNIYTTIIQSQHPYGENNTTKNEYDLNNNNSYKYYKIIVNSSWYTISYYYGGIGTIQFIGDYFKYLLQDNNNLCNTDDVGLFIRDTLPYTIDKFNTYGMGDLSNINETVISKINNNKYNIDLLK